MTKLLEQGRYQLGKRELVAIDDARDVVLTCEAGELWVTREGEGRDLILVAGESCTTEGRLPVVVSAFRPSTLAVVLPQGFATDARSGV